MSVRSNNTLRLTAGGVLLVGSGGGAALLAGVAGAQTVDPAALEPQVAQTYTVANTNDSGAGSLRAAVTSANANAGADTITFDPSVTGTITLSSTLEITEGVTITGPGSGVLNVSGGDAVRVFRTSGIGDVSISGLEISRGLSHDGAAIRSDNAGALNLDSVKVDHNRSTQWAALYLENSGQVTISNSEINDNVSDGSVSALYIGSATDVLISGTSFTGNVGTGSTVLMSGANITLDSVTVDSNQSTDSAANTATILMNPRSSSSILNSTISNNSGAGATSKQALRINGNNTVTSLIANSTVTGNSAMKSAVWVFGNGPARIVQSTITGNAGPELYLRNGVSAASQGSVISDGTATDIAVTSGGSARLVSSNSILGGSDAGVTVDDTGGTLRNVTDLKLGALANNGGRTKTRLPLPGSPLLNAGGTTVPTFPGNQFDQRGSGFARLSGGAIDIGAVEVQVQVPTVGAVAPPTGPTSGGTTITLTGTNFAAGMTVTVGGAACMNVTVLSATSATCVTPSGTAGGAAVVVTGVGGSATLADGFTFVADPNGEVVPTFTG